MTAPSTFLKNSICSITACACLLLSICTHIAAAPTENDESPRSRSSVDSFSQSAASVVMSIPISIMIVVSVATGQSDTKLKRIEDVLPEEEEVTIQDITPITDDAQRWTLQRASDKKVISLEVRGSHLHSPDDYPLGTAISVSTEQYGTLLHQNNQVIAFFINPAGIEKFGISL